MAAKKEKIVEELDVEKTVDVLKLGKELIKQINKDSDEKIAWCLGTDTDNPTDVKDFISTGSTLLNFIIKNGPGGGVPVGKLTEICGEEATGKSLLAAHILANTQKKGGLAVLIDTENAFNTEFATRVGVNMNELVYLQPGSIEEVGESIEKIITLVRAKDVKKIVTIVWDSVAGTPPKAELEGTFDPNDRIGVAAKALAKMMRKLTQTVGKDRVTLVFTNQLKVKIGVMYGDPMMTPGGKAIPYHASLRIRVSRSTELKDDAKQTYAVHTRAKVIKSRLGPPLRKCEFDIHFANGIDDVNSVRDFLHECGEITKADGWMRMPCVDIEKFEGAPVKDDEKGLRLQFREAAFAGLMKHPEFARHVGKLLEKNLVVRFDTNEVPRDLDMDPDSLMDVEAVNDHVTEGLLNIAAGVSPE